jgi:hypothetical protein
LVFVPYGNEPEEKNVSRIRKKTFYLQFCMGGIYRLNPKS